MCIGKWPWGLDFKHTCEESTLDSCNPDFPRRSELPMLKAVTLSAEGVIQHGTDKANASKSTQFARTDAWVSLQAAWQNHAVSMTHAFPRRICKYSVYFQGPQQDSTAASIIFRVRLAPSELLL